MDAKLVLEQFHDYLAPKLDTYEQAIYLYVLRHSRLQGLDEIVVGFKSARRRIAMGIGEKGKPMAERTCYDKLRSLQAKGCLQVVASEQNGTRLRLRLPNEIEGLIVAVVDDIAVGLKELDFFSIPEYRLAILQRDGNRCAYLNLVAAATPSYKESHDDRGDEKKRWKNRYSDWQSLNREIAGYRLLCDEDNPNYNHKQIETLAKAFEEKRQKLFVGEGYKSFDRDDDESWRYPDSGHSYWNDYGQVFFRNMNANRDSHRAEHWFTDYYEEEP